MEDKKKKKKMFIHNTLYVTWSVIPIFVLIVYQDR